MSSRVFIVEDEPVVMMGIAYLLEQLGMEVVGDSTTGEDALNLLASTRPSIVLMDVLLPGIDGIETTRLIKQNFPGVYVIMLTSLEDEQSFFASFAAGADGYCCKSMNRVELGLAIAAVENGGVWIDPAVASCIATYHPQNSVAGVSDRKELGLSVREFEVLRLMVDGLSNKEISERLTITIDTVKTHVKRILAKLRVSDRTQACVKAIRENLIS
ncbi:MAG: response regulator transcription factor [Candidatus Obscuribacterales bacterium]|nr:response regulator transcription factor [Candidatus Obscuribacterales bacterium]